ncbi:MAG: aspartate ammonia-lyase, partial [Pseudorhodobacter sp.]|nr:aspartate ammonia-lyase [Frankiaceae bacterium]
MSDQRTRTEHDSMGDVEVPYDALWRAQTQRAVSNFPATGRRVEPGLVRARAAVKGAAARTNADLGVLPQDLADAIAHAAQQIVGGAHAD